MRSVGVIFFAVLLAISSVATERIHIVGSSTVFPFSAAAAEEFGRSSSFPTPVVESTGSGGGLKLFCAGVGSKHPDIANASRRIKKAELEKCRSAGIGVAEIKIGYDGIVLASAKGGLEIDLASAEIFLALAKQTPSQHGLAINSNQKWRDINASLPDSPIEVLGPPPTSGTRDAFVELAMEKGARNFDFFAGLSKSEFKKAAHSLREDGRFIEAGENDNLIVQKLRANPAALGIFGFGFLDQNADSLRAAKVDGVAPTFENISSGEYAVSRSLFFYVKRNHLDATPGLREFVAAFVSEDFFGEEGSLTDKGLIPLPFAEREEMRKIAREFPPLESLE